MTPIECYKQVTELTTALHDIERIASDHMPRPDLARILDICERRAVRDLMDANR